MKHILELNVHDIREALADHFKVDVKRVTVITGMRPVGYGMDEHDEPFVRAEVEIDKEENK